MGRPRKRPLELSNGQAQADKENVQVAPVLADGEEHTSAKSIRCQHTAKQKQLIVLYARHHGVRPTERKLAISRNKIQRWLKNFRDDGFEQISHVRDQQY